MNKLISFTEKFSISGIHSIKLRNLLELRAIEDETKQIKTMFPPIEIGSITLVDQIILLSLIELVRPDRILEIGTYQGYSTRLFVENSDAVEILTIDLPPLASIVNTEVDVEKVLYDGEYNDDYLRSVQNTTGAKYLNDLSPVDIDRVTLIKSDSTKLDFSDQIGPVQFAFIDGGHSYDIVKQDTANVTSQIKLGVVVWHDYASSIHSDVTRFLEEYSKSNQIFYIKGGLCAFQIINNQND